MPLGTASSGCFDFFRPRNHQHLSVDTFLRRSSLRLPRGSAWESPGDVCCCLCELQGEFVDGGAHVSTRVVCSTSLPQGSPAQGAQPSTVRDHRSRRMGGREMAEPCKIPPDKEDFQGMKTSPCQATVCVCGVGPEPLGVLVQRGGPLRGCTLLGCPLGALERLGDGVLSAKLTAP